MRGAALDMCTTFQGGERGSIDECHLGGRSRGRKRALKRGWRWGWWVWSGTGKEASMYSQGIGMCETAGS